MFIYSRCKETKNRKSKKKIEEKKRANTSYQKWIYMWCVFFSRRIWAFLYCGNGTCNLGGRKGRGRGISSYVRDKQKEFVLAVVSNKNARKDVKCKKKCMAFRCVLYGYFGMHLFELLICTIWTFLLFDDNNKKCNSLNFSIKNSLEAIKIV